MSGGAGGGGGRELDFREKKKMQKEGEFLLDGCPIPGNNPHHPRTRYEPLNPYHARTMYEPLNHHLPRTRYKQLNPHHPRTRHLNP